MTAGLLTAAVFRDGHKEARIESVGYGSLRPDEVLVRIVATGLCHTDVSCRAGPMALPRPIVLGHEGAGIVEHIGEAVSSLSPGDKVVVSFAACGDCAPCRAGRSAYCDLFVPGNLSGRRVDGSTALAGDVAGHFFGQSSFASHSIVRARNAVRIRADAPLELLGPLACGVLTGAGAVMNVLRPQPGETIAIFGAGGVGLSAVMAAALAGCASIIVVEPHAARRALALGVGATHVIDPAMDDPGDRLAALTSGGVDYAIDTSGAAGAIGAAIEGLRPRGQLALITASTPGMMLSLPLMQLLLRGIGLRGVSMGDAEPRILIPILVDLIMAGRFPLDRLVRFYDFADINVAFDDQESGAVVKPILRIG